MHYYKKNIGDYHKKAGRLTMQQHGAYTLLMDSCYDREKFPTLDEAIDWCWASTEAEIEAVKFVLGKFFTLDDGVFVQERISDELDTYHKNSAINKRIAIERETKRKNKNTKRGRSVDEPPPNQEPLTKNHKPLNKYSLDDMSVAEAIYAAVVTISPTMKKPNMGTWADTIRLMRDRDKRTHEDIIKVFKWANADIFWQTNILSPAKLRKQYDQLVVKMSTRTAGQPQRNNFNDLNYGEAGDL